MKLDRLINRTVLSTVISIWLVILGFIGLATLPITQYPDIAPPTVSVSATYTGANAQAVLNSVISPLEDQINGVENMMYMQSTATNNGSARITVYFNQGTDPDMAQVNVQNRVTQAQGLLPAEVTQVGVTTQKRQTSMLMVFSVYDKEDKYNIEFLENYASINLIPEIKRVSGVGDANVMGTDYSMRIWLKPDVMAQYKLVPSDITGVLAEQNVEAAPGQFGERGNQSFQYTIRYKGRLSSTTEFGDIVIKSLSNGEVLRLKDVAEMELGRLTYNFNNTVNGHKAVSCIVYQMAGTNATETIQNLEKVLAEYEKNLPEGLGINIAQSANDFLFASIHEVVKTLIEAFILVFIVVYIFLQDMRSTLIPAIAIPVALIATFFALTLIGFSINLLTLSAMVLAIAIVVDDAIVVVEGVHAKLDQGYKSAREASIDAMSELGSAIVSITLVMMSVFIPVSFMSGTAGTFYRQFLGTEPQDKEVSHDIDSHQQKARLDAGPDAFRLTCPVVLSAIGCHRHTQALQRTEEEHLDTHGGSEGCHAGCSQCIVGTLQHDAANGGDGELQSHRNSDTQHVQCQPTVKPTFGGCGLQNLELPHHVVITQESRQALGDDRGYRSTCHSPSQHQDAEKVEQNIEDGGKQQEPERCLTVSQRTDDAGKQVVEERTRHTDKGNEQVQIRIVEDVFRSTHRTQDKGTKQTRHNGNQDRHDRRQLQARPHILAHRRIVMRPELLGNRNAETSTTAVAEPENQEDDRAACPDGSEGIYT